MRRYIRQRQKGGVYFIMVVTQARVPILIANEHISILRSSFRWVKRKYPFEIDAIVILPDHIHCIWRPPDGDDNYPARWSLIKRYFSRGANLHLPRGDSRVAKGRREFGSDAIGNTLFVMSVTGGTTWITSITTQSSMVMWIRYPGGHTVHFNIALKKVGMTRTGETVCRKRR